MFTLGRSAFSVVLFLKELNLVKVCKGIGVRQGKAAQGWVAVGFKGKECILQWTPAGYTACSCTAIL